MTYIKDVNADSPDLPGTCRPGLLIGVLHKDSVITTLGRGYPLDIMLELIDSS